MRSSHLSRRNVLRFGTVAVAGTGAGLFQGLRARRAGAESFGDLVADPNGILDLPEGFTYTILQETGAKMSDGQSRRSAPDGMAAFRGKPGETILLLNHELSLGMGGVSRIVIDDASLEVLSSNDVLQGTTRNCAGGPSPWGWLSCEETTGGGVWLCPVKTSQSLTTATAQRIDDYGSFQHEAVAIDPESLTAYLTEDDGESHFYRMVPTDPRADPFSGTLQALARVGEDDFDTSSMTVGESFEAQWVDVSPENARNDAKTNRAAIFHRGEGVWFHGGDVYFSATSYDQIFKVSFDGDKTTVELVANDFDSPDNITVAPWGDIYVAEDQGGRCRIRIVDPNGAVTNFAANAAGTGQELAGVCFAPDGQTLFVNMQKEGYTVAVRGPFPEMMAEGTGGTDGADGTNDDSPMAGDAGGATAGGATATAGNERKTASSGSEGEMTPSSGCSQTPSAPLAASGAVATTLSVAAAARLRRQGRDVT